MKSKGDNCEFHADRQRALRQAFRAQMRAAHIINMSVIAKKAVEQPSPRFYVSEERAMAVISQMMRGKPVLKGMLPTKRRMFDEIYRRVMEIKRARPRTPLCNMITEVLYQPAPEFYISPRTAMDIVNAQCTMHNDKLDYDRYINQRK